MSRAYVTKRGTVEGLGFGTLATKTYTRMFIEEAIHMRPLFGTLHGRAGIRNGDNVYTLCENMKLWALNKFRSLITDIRRKSCSTYDPQHTDILYFLR